MLTIKQKKVAQAVYEGRLSETEIAEQFKISPQLLGKWLQSETFQQELHRLCETSIHETRCIISRFGPTAALQLATLLSSEKDDTKRRAALDLVDRCLAIQKQTQADTNPTDDEEPISDAAAKAMLLELAKGWA